MISKGASERLAKLIRIHKASMFILQEPFLSSDKLEEYRRYLGFAHAISNNCSKLWCFWNNGLECETIDNSRQQITFKIKEDDYTYWITAVYARNIAVKRRKLWNKLRNMSTRVNGPWSILGDFNIIMAPEEKKGGTPHVLSKSADFISYMDDCGMTDLGYTGNPFTWKEIQSQQEGKTKEQESSSANSNNQIMSPFTADTACIQSKGGKITIDMGTLVHLQGELNNKHGPDIDNNSIYESGEDMDSNHSQEASTDDEITENSRGESEDDEDEQVADSLLEAFAPSPKQFDDPVAKETEEVIQKQGLSPRGNKRRNHKGASERLAKLIRIHKASMVILQEPFLSSDKLEEYRRYLGFDHAISNNCSKLWCFWNNGLECETIDNSRQQITFKIKEDDYTYWITAVYARNSAVKRRKLWNKLRNMSNRVNGPWSILGDFNIIMAPEEKKGGTPHVLSKSADFISCMDDCGMTDLGYTGNPFTWCNGSRGRRRISTRLDRVLINEDWAGKFQINRVDHHAKSGSDHSLITFKFGNENHEAIKYFRFLNFWTKQSDYNSLVENTWNKESNYQNWRCVD
ncbi:hypothetical protein A4A49_35599 [Nicotiana attenuata]|uniref:Endonuclease/exonuclease/phosphatase domain-containing protein n=1 Tax=Nicotiana attenuata TaxID=49451 RepID=A0A1J6KGX2_NICAT|nr:hypothetical protein A4A49_35599 [Nicotiana attenuata]